MRVSDTELAHFYTPYYPDTGKHQPTLNGTKLACFGWCVDSAGNLVAVDAQGSSDAVRGLYGKVVTGDGVSCSFSPYDRQYANTRNQRYVKVPRSFIISEESDDVGVCIMSKALLEYVPLNGGPNNSYVPNFYIPDMGSAEDTAKRLLARISQSDAIESKSLIRFGLQDNWAQAIMSEALGTGLMRKIEKTYGYNSRTVLGFQIYECNNQQNKWEELVKKLLERGAIKIELEYEGEVDGEV
jgi:hypothetical protein